MKVLLTSTSKNCKHERIICENCGAIAFKEKKFTKKDIKRFEEMAKKVRKTFEEEEKAVCSRSDMMSGMDE